MSSTNTPADDSHATTRTRPVGRPSLLWRVFAANGVVLLAATAALALAPATVSQPITLSEAVIITIGAVVLLSVNLLLLRRTVRPLERLTDAMVQIDPLRHGARIAIPNGDREIAVLAESFNEMLDRLEHERRESARRALAAQESERRRVAQDLHDEIGQRLTGVMLVHERLARLVPDEHKRHMTLAREETRCALEEVRRIANRLRPGALDDLGLPSALSSLAMSVADQSGVTVQRRLSQTLPRLTEEAEVVVFRIAQEALTNVVRHARARTVTLGLSHGPDGVLLSVRDDGRGIGEQAWASPNGIRGMRERALLIGARLTVRRAAQGGTEVLLEVPPSEMTTRPRDVPTLCPEAA